jgi:8-oxo-dGTP pyrophosphatase MutT (NUDIX family)
MTWRPDLTVAAIVQREGRFLMVEERIARSVVFNQPAGHVEDRESVLQAVIRETLEETAWHFVPRHMLGIYLWRNDDNGRTTVRVAVCGDVTGRDPELRLDHGIIAAHWLSRDELIARSGRLRNPLVLRCVDDYLAGQRYDLDALAHIETPAEARSA